MSELLPDCASKTASELSEKGERNKANIVSIAQWVECINAYIGVVVYRQPERVPDLLAYSSLIVHTYVHHRNSKCKVGYSI